MEARPQPPACQDPASDHHKEFGLEFIDITMAQRERLRTLVMKVR